MKSHVLVSDKPGEIQLKEMELPEPAENEIQIRVESSVISPGTERAFVLNMENTSGVYPMYPGYSSAGIVEKVGKDVMDFKVGDRVACHGVTHRSIGNIRERRAAKIPDEVSFEDAAFTSLGVIALQGVRKARTELGESGVVIGLGIIGQLALQLMKNNGAVPVVGVDRARNRMDLAKQCGADVVLNSADEGWEKALSQWTDGKGPEVVIECTGVPQVINTALEAVRNFGRVVILSSTRGDTTVNFYRDVHKKAITILGAHISGNPVYESRPGFWSWRDDADAFMKLLMHKRISVEPLVTQKVDWNKIEGVYREMLKGSLDMIGTLIHWNT